MVHVKDTTTTTITTTSPSPSPLPPPPPPLSTAVNDRQRVTHRCPVTDVVPIGRVRLGLDNANRVRLPERGKGAVQGAGIVLVVAHLSKAREGTGDGCTAGAGAGGRGENTLLRSHARGRRHRPGQVQQASRAAAHAGNWWRKSPRPGDHETR